MWFSVFVLITHASGNRCMGRVISGICDFLCACVYLRSKRKTT